MEGYQPLRPECTRLARHRKFMKAAFDVVTIEEVQEPSYGFIIALYRRNAIYTRLARMELREEQN